MYMETARVARVTRTASITILREQRKDRNKTLEFHD